jgi:hypothetical protein
LRSQRTRLLHAAKFFRTRGIRDLRQLDHGAVEAYMEHLKMTPGARSPRRSWRAQPRGCSIRPPSGSTSIWSE